VCVCVCVCVCETLHHLCSLSSGFVPLILPLSQLPLLCLTLSLSLSLAFFSITPFDDEQLIAVLGHEPSRGRGDRVIENGEERENGGGRGRDRGRNGMSQGREDKCLRSLVTSEDGSPAGMISAAVIDSLPPA